MTEKIREIRLFNQPVFCPSPLDGWFPGHGKIVEIIIPRKTGTGMQWAENVNLTCEEKIVTVGFFLPSGIQTQSPVLCAELSDDNTIHPDLAEIPHDVVKLTIQLTPEQLIDLIPAGEPFEFGY